MDKDLVKIIKENPGCTFTIDNDCWWCTSKDGKELANDRNVKELGDGGVMDQDAHTAAMFSRH